MHPNLFLVRNMDMDRNFKNIPVEFSEIEPPKILKTAVFEAIEREKMRMLARQKFLFQACFALCGFFVFSMLAIFGKEILSSEFASLLAIGVSDLKTVSMFWEEYVFSLLETLPAFSIFAMLFPIFIFLLLLKQYAKFQQSCCRYALKT